MNQGAYPHHHVVAPLNGANSASGAIFRTTKYTVCANVITTQSSVWRRQALISGPCDQHFLDSHQNPLGSTTKACFFYRKLYDQSNSLNSVRFCNISVRPGDHAPFLETHGNSVRLGRSVIRSELHKSCKYYLFQHIFIFKSRVIHCATSLP